MKSFLFSLCFSVISFASFAQRNNPRYLKEEATPVSTQEVRSDVFYEPIRVQAPKTPKTFTLFGERMPLELWDVRERFDRELLVNTYMQGSTSYIIKQMGRWLPMIEKKLAEHGVPDDFKYLCIAESALQNQVSKVGASGFWQFMRETAPQYGLYIDNEVDERYNPEKSTDAACRYLKDAYAKFGNWTNAAASYNCGMGGMNSALASQGETSFYHVLLPEETMRYIFRIAALKYILSNQKQFGFMLSEDDVYKPHNVRREIVNGSLGSLIAYAKSQGTNYKTLKMLNPWLRDKTLTNSKGRSYTILLPKN